MKTTILSVNSGSSSIKISVYSLKERHADPEQIAEVRVSGLTAPPMGVSYVRRGQRIHKDMEPPSTVRTPGDAFKMMVHMLIDDPELSDIARAEDIAITCHRIVHGGDFTEAQLVTRETYHTLELLSDLAPLHNGAALDNVKTCIELLPKTRNVACFDSQFHATMPPHVSTYPIDQEIARKNHLRKYGFHGISYAFIARNTASALARDASDLNVIALHLGSGASACAIRAGKSWDTSMGLTPLAGLPGATRSGSIDPSLVFHYASDVGKLSPSSTANLHISTAEEILNKKSGWSALAGTTDFSVIARRDTPERRLAFDLFVGRVAGYVGSYFVALEGRVDALVFAGGIGEKSAALREAVVHAVRCLGFAVDAKKNEDASSSSSVVEDITAAATDTDAGSKSTPRVLVCQTDEQFEMARICSSRDDLWE
ncbi:acetate kinase [Geosmithia morbida]|uniref:Probable acetate kinase n=1 Tax=Geosmithia morbida TaxID=1094350 RepID=A0A9P5D0D3_9HYPO|nr:acetate kinase [Geosmithia morbida]KAF4122613.1 acetate kinase [Geosmithia morbida]